MRVFRRVFFDASLEKDALAEREAGQANQVLVRAARNDAEFGLQVDLAGIIRSEVEEKAGGVIDQLGSCRHRKNG